MTSILVSIPTVTKTEHPYRISWMGWMGITSKLRFGRPLHVIVKPCNNWMAHCLAIWRFIYGQFGSRYAFLYISVQNDVVKSHCKMTCFVLFRVVVVVVVVVVVSISCMENFSTEYCSNRPDHLPGSMITSFAPTCIRYWPFNDSHQRLWG